jgi:hypothetical protein
MAARKKKTNPVERIPVFDINEWVNTRKKERRSTSDWDDSQIKYSVKKHKSRNDLSVLTIYMKKKIIRMLDGSEKPRIIVMQHRGEGRRIMLTKSINGYRVGQPKTSKLYFIRCNIEYSCKEEKFTGIVDPLFHEKGISSGAIIEFTIQP